jgi:hypothetical protein
MLSASKTFISVPTGRNYQSVESLAQAAQSLVEVLFTSRGSARATGVESTEVDAASDAKAQVSGTGGPSSRLVCYIVLHASPRINLCFDRLNRASQAWIERSRVNAISI